MVEAAAFALMRRNTGLALDLISQAESIARGREEVVLMPGVYWKMRTFKMAHVGRADEAFAVLFSLSSIWRKRAVFHYLDILAAKAWLEMRENGKLTDETRQDLGLFEVLGLDGRRQLMVLQGFLFPLNDLSKQNPNRSGQGLFNEGSSPDTRLPPTNTRLHAQ
jgi:hypothetical protein